MAGEPAPVPRRPVPTDYYDDAPCGYVAMALDGTVLAANRTMVRSLGQDASAVIGRPFDALLTPASRLYFHSHWRPLLDLHGEAREVPADLRRADGGPLSVLINARLVEAGDDEPAGIRVIVFDATDRRRYERELVTARNEERVRREHAERSQRFATALMEATTPEDVARVALQTLGALLGSHAGELIHDDVVLARLGDGLVDDTEASIAFPLFLGGAPGAELRLARGAGRPASPDPREDVDALARQVAPALSRALAHDDLLTRSAQQAAIASLSATALQQRSVELVHREAVRQVRRVLGVQHACVERADGPPCAAAVPHEGDELVLRQAIESSSGRRGTLHVRSAPGGRRSLAADRDFVLAVANVVAHATDRIRQEELVGHQATHDALTGLANRALLNERLDQEIAQARRDGTGFAMCLLDIDDFKTVNDSLGHDIGDRLLRGVGERLVAAVRSSDLVVRLGGDEFVVLQSGETGSDGVAALGARICRALEEPFAHRGLQHTARASVGAVLGDGGSTREGLLRDADIAMYHAKDQQPGGHVRFDQSMRELVRQRLQIEQELRVALREGQLRVHYQPVFDADARRLVGFEALVRWLHPSKGLVPPDAFIPVAESTGLILDLGRHVLDTACRQLAAWHHDGRLDDDVTMSVNVSGRQLSHPAFLGEVAEALRRSHLDATPWLLGLEITESVLMETSTAPVRMLASLADLGVRLLLDDFGTGASSLARLKRFPVDTLKIDRAFVAGIVPEGGGEDDLIVAAIVAMGKALGLRIVAEGVEEEHQAEALSTLGCHDLQGFLLGRPMPAEALEERLRSSGARAEAVARPQPLG